MTWTYVGSHNGTANSLHCPVGNQMSPNRPEGRSQMMRGYRMRDRYENPHWLKRQMRVDSHGILRWQDSGQIPSVSILCRLSLPPEEGYGPPCRST